MNFMKFVVTLMYIRLFRKVNEKLANTINNTKKLREDKDRLLKETMRTTLYI
uniref:Uncharacterized protein n=1 Tax=viral metagenome TaxID=1070528 RepID=A0A6C0HZ59_9ZZZZ